MIEKRELLRGAGDRQAREIHFSLAASPAMRTPASSATPTFR